MSTLNTSTIHKWAPSRPGTWYGEEPGPSVTRLALCRGFCACQLWGLGSGFTSLSPHFPCSAYACHSQRAVHVG